MVGRKASASRMSRRTVILGAAASTAALGLAVPAAASPEPTPSPASSTELSSPSAALIALGQELKRLVRRCGRLQRQMHRLDDRADQILAERSITQQLSNERRNPAVDAVRSEVGGDAAWQRWSHAASELESVAATIAKTPAHNLTDLLIKYRALRWALIEDDSQAGGANA